MYSTRIQNITEAIFGGGTPSTQDSSFWDGGIPWLSSGETSKPFISSTERTISAKGVANSSTRLARKNDIVIASAGQGMTRGQTSFLLIDTYINQSIIAVRADNEQVLSKYLYYNLYSRYEEMRLLSNSSSSRGSITTKMIGNLEISLPSLAEQRHIVDVMR